MSHQEFKAAPAPDESIRIDSCVCEIDLDSQGRFGRYAYTFNISNISAVDEVSWEFSIPAASDQVIDVWAKDAHGSLQTHTEPANRGSTRLVVRYREQLQIANSYSFDFGYQCPIPAIIIRQMFHRIVTLFNWLTHGQPCESQTIRMKLPPGATPISGIPSVQIRKNVVEFPSSSIRANEPFTCLIGYRQFAVGGQFLIWLLSAIGSGVIGYLIRLLTGSGS